MRISKDQPIVNATMDADIIAEHQIEHQWLACVQAVWTGGTADGALKVQGSINQETWEDLSGLAVVVSGDGSVLWDITQTGIPYIRVVYTFSSGTGVLNVWISGKGV